MELRSAEFKVGSPSPNHGHDASAGRVILRIARHAQISETSRLDSLPVVRETEPYDSARERSSLMLLMKRIYADLNRRLARLLPSAEILAQKRENLLVN
jgi:hypothetical protein